MDVGQDTTLCDGDVSEKLVQLLVVPDGELEVAGDDTGLLVVAGSVAGQLEDLGSQVLEDGGEVDRGASTNTLGVVALTEQTVNTADGERETGLGRAAIVTEELAPKAPRAGPVSRDRDGAGRLTIACSWNRWPCRRTCRLQSFWLSFGVGKSWEIRW